MNRDDRTFFIVQLFHFPRPSAQNASQLHDDTEDNEWIFNS